jgi:hypothetical protein
MIGGGRSPGDCRDVGYTIRSIAARGRFCQGVAHGKTDVHGGRRLTAPNYVLLQDGLYCVRSLGWDGDSGCPPIHWGNRRGPFRCRAPPVSPKGDRGVDKRADYRCEQPGIFDRYVTKVKAAAGAHGHARSTARVTSSVRMWSSTAQPSTRRECSSRIAHKCTSPSPQLRYVMSDDHTASVRPSITRCAARPSTQGQTNAEDAA